SLLLVACSSKKEAPTNSSETPAQTLETDTVSKYAKDLAYAINNPNANFPQLSTEIADNEAAVKLKTNLGDITLKLFPEEAP
ncbi:peptidylprolyl isomerase, partial [Streptococcus pyogenes]